MAVLKIALDVPLPRLFDYSFAGASTELIGKRVVVPFGSGRKVGVVVAVAATSELPTERLREAEAVLEDMPALDKEWMALARFCSDYYQRPLGEVIHAALPPHLRRTTDLAASPQAYAITPAGRDALQGKLRGKAQRILLERLASTPVLAVDLPASATRRQLLQKGWIAACTPPGQNIALSIPHALTPAQQDAVDAVTAKSGSYAPFLLLGVTGSGKTEVYLHAIAATLARGQQVLMLVPEINLTPHLDAQLRERLPGLRLVTLTSALPDKERALRWLSAQRGEADVVLGTRLAVFAPLPNIGLVIVDEEHDPSFKQQEGVRYSARDLAIFRASRLNAPVVLGSATPSLESFAQTLSGRYTLLELPQRARTGAGLPTLHMIDTRDAKGDDGISSALADAINARLARQEQSLIFLNRRGYAPVLACGACAWVGDCPRCTAHLVVHLKEGRLRCHHCGHVAPIPRHCPQCGNVDLLPFGRGTQRLEDSIAARFPTARVLRIDSDSTRSKGSWEAMHASISAGEVDLLIGTQILAKGHDFPRLTLVGVLNTDSALLAPDYRAPERLFAQLHQVAGRAGRADLPGEVLIQTRYPAHPLYQALLHHDYKGFAASLLAEREQAGFPPFIYEAVLRAESREMKDAIAFLQRVRHLAEPDEAVQYYDPVAMSLPRMNGWERAQLLLQSRSRSALQRSLRQWMERLYASKAGPVRWHLDVDPIEF